MDTSTTPPTTSLTQSPDVSSLSGHIASSPKSDPHQPMPDPQAPDPMMIDPTTEDGLRRAGYEGFVTIGALREHGFGQVPDHPGVYLTLYPSEDAPRFLPVSPAGEIAGESATIPVDELEEFWVPDALILYAGMAGGKGKKATLRSRVEQYLDFGRGQKVRHRDGRAVWQIVRSSMLVMCWLPTPRADPWGKRNSLLTAFKDRFGSAPFANRAGKSPY